MDQMHPRCKMRLSLLPALFCLAGGILHAPPAAAQTANIDEKGKKTDTGDTTSTDKTPVFQLRGSTTSPTPPAPSVVTPVEDPFAGDPLFNINAEPAPDNNAGPAAESVLPAPPSNRQQAQALPDEKQAKVLPEPPERPVLDPESGDTPETRANTRARPVQTGEKRLEKADPYAQLGFRMGIWQVFSRLEQSIGYATNNSSSAGGKPGAFSQTDANVEMRSNWARHEASIIAKGSLRHALGSDVQDIPEASVDGDLRLDLIDDYTGNLHAKYGYSTESLTSQSLSASVADRPTIQEFGGSGEIARNGGLLELSLRGSADRTVYGDAQLTDGTTESQADRNNTLYQVTSRVAYGPTPSLKPFVQAGIGWRVFDQEVDRNGENRSSMLYDLRGGIKVDLHDKLKGEIAVGYATEDFNASTIKTKDAVTLNGTLDWSPERDTKLTFAAATNFGGATTAGDNGSINYTFGVDAERRVRDNLVVNGKASYALNRYDTSGGSEQTYTLGTGIEYWVSRYLALTADVEYQRFLGTTSASSWDSTSVRMGVALQR